MSEYIFNDCNEEPYTEYGIDGDSFHDLLRVCARYCPVMSVAVLPTDEEVLSVIRQFLLDEKDVPLYQQEKKMAGYLVIHGTKLYEQYYRVCPGLLNELANIASDDLFTMLHGWGYTNPEDPTFYRADGSIFFESVVHEGACYLHARKDEDVDMIIRNPGWRRRI